MNLQKHKHQADKTIEKLARAGYATKGVVYTILGGLSVQAAISGGSATGDRVPSEPLGSSPLGHSC